MQPGLFYKHLCHSLIHWLTPSTFVEISSEHLLSQTVSARELKILEKVHLPQTCHVSHVTCRVSHVTIPFCLFLFPDRVEKLVGGGSVINWATPSSFLLLETWLVKMYSDFAGLEGLGGFCLVLEFHCGGSATNGATPTSSHEIIVIKF